MQKSKLNQKGKPAINKHAGYLNGKRFLLFLLSISCNTILIAQEKTAEVDKIFNSVSPASPGCICAVSQNGNVMVNRAYGSADLERNVPLTTASVLDAASVVKQFVAASVLMLVEEGRLSLTEDIRKYLKELPDYGHKITLDHLLTHTSGIREWTGIRALAEGDLDALMLTLRQRGLNFKPGDEWSYSNSGYVLLKEIVARTSGLSFGEFTRKRIFEPFTMTSTAYVHDLTSVIKNRALAYKKEGENWKLDMEVGNDRGGGGALFSTPVDLLRWNEALANGKLGPFVTEKLQQPAVLNNGRTIGYARGLMLDDFRRGGKLVWHSGGSAGYSTLLARLPEQGLSLALMCNVDGGAKSALAGRVFDLFLPPANSSASPEKTPPPAIASVDVKGKAGLYFNAQNGQSLRLVDNNNTLSIAGVGPLLPVANNQFKSRGSTMNFLSGAAYEIQFLTDSQFELMTMDGEKIRYNRAKPFTPSPKDFQQYTGKYESNEMGSVLEIVPQDEGMVMRFYRNHAKSIKLNPVDTDTFMFGNMTVRFQRDKNGKITGYLYSNPLVRNIPFTRLP